MKDLQDKVNFFGSDVKVVASQFDEECERELECELELELRHKVLLVLARLVHAGLLQQPGLRGVDEGRVQPGLGEGGGRILVTGACCARAYPAGGRPTAHILSSLLPTSASYRQM